MGVVVVLVYVVLGVVDVVLIEVLVGIMLVVIFYVIVVCFFLVMCLGIIKEVEVEIEGFFGEFIFNIRKIVD